MCGLFALPQFTKCTGCKEEGLNHWRGAPQPLIPAWLCLHLGLHVTGPESFSYFSLASAQHQLTCYRSCCLFLLRTSTPPILPTPTSPPCIVLPNKCLCNPWYSMVFLKLCIDICNNLSQYLQTLVSQTSRQYLLQTVSSLDSTCIFLKLFSTPLGILFATLSASEVVYMYTINCIFYNKESVAVNLFSLWLLNMTCYDTNDIHLCMYPQQLANSAWEQFVVF